MKELTAQDIMSTRVVWVKEEMTVSEVIELFMEEMISGAPVVNSEGVMTGVVSLRDCVRHGNTTERFVSGAQKTLFYEEGWELPLSDEEIAFFHLDKNSGQAVKEIMTPMLFSVTPETPISELADMMLKGRIHRMLVLDDDELVGIVTTMDMLKVIRELMPKQVASC